MVSAAAVVAALVAGVGGALGTLCFLSWGPPSGVVRASAVLAGIAGVVVLVAARRTRDRRALAFAVSVLAFAVMWVGPAWAVGVLLVVVQGALVAFGVLTSRDERARSGSSVGSSRCRSCARSVGASARSGHRPRCADHPLSPAQTEVSADRDQRSPAAVSGASSGTDQGSEVIPPPPRIERTVPSAARS